MSNKLAKDDTLQSVATANGSIATNLSPLTSLGKDTTLQTIATKLDAINTTLSNGIPSSSSSSSGGGATITNSTVEITGGTSTITGGNTWFTEDMGGVANITGGTTTITGGVIYVGELDSIPSGYYLKTPPSVTAQAHNQNCVVANLGTTISQAQSDAIKSGNFHNLYPGSYWEREITFTIPYDQEFVSDANGTVKTTYNGLWGSNGYGTNDYLNRLKSQTITKNVRMRIYHLDYLFDEYNTEHHIVVMPDQPLFWCPMSPENGYFYIPGDTTTKYKLTYTETRNGISSTITKGYAETEFFNSWISGAESAFIAFFGEDHIYKHQERLIKNYVSHDNRPAQVMSAYYKNRICDLPSAQMIFSEDTIANYGRNSNDTQGSSDRLIRDEALEQFALLRLNNGDTNYFKTTASDDDDTRIDWVTRSNYSSDRYIAINSASNTSETLTYRGYNVVYGIRPYALIY